MGIILEDDPAEHCFLLRDLFPISFFKLVLVMLLKTYHAHKMFGKICLKVIRTTFFSNMWSVIWGRKWDWGWYPAVGKVQTFSLSWGGSPIPFLVWHPDHSIRKILKSDWSAYCNDFEKSEWEYFFSKQQIYSMNKRWQILWWHPVYW